MIVKTLVVGALQTNCYIVTKNNQTIIIDPGEEYEKIKKEIQEKNVVGILVTHHHFDHVGALKQLEDDLHLIHNQSITNFEYEVIETPGHTKDSITYYFPKEKTMFTGDFIFQGAIGRMDLGGSPIDMIKSIKKIITYPEDITIYPGHGPSSTLKEEIPRLKEYI